MRILGVSAFGATAFASDTGPEVRTEPPILDKARPIKGLASKNLSAFTRRVK